MAKMSWLARFFGQKTRSSVVAPVLVNMGYQRNSELLTEEANQKVALVYRCVRAKSTNATQVPVQAMRQVGGKGRGRMEVLPDSHPLSQLIKRPNEEDDFSAILESAVTHLQLRGEGFWELELGGPGEGGLGRPARIYSWPTQWLTKIDVNAQTGQYTNFRIQARGLRMDIPGERGLFFKFYNPIDPTRGLAPLSAAYQAADTNYAAMLFNAAFFERGGVPSLVVKVSDNAPIDGFTDTQDKELRAQFRSLYAGLKNQQSIMVLGPHLDVKTVGSDLKDISFEKLLKFNNQEILSAFGCVPIIVGDVDNANRANAIEQRRLFWEETMIPEMEDMLSLMNRKLCPAFGRDVFLRFDYSAVPAMRKDLKALSDAYVPLMFPTNGQPAITINEFREEVLGKPPVPWGDGPVELPGTPPGNDADPTRQFVDPEVARGLLREWKNNCIQRINDQKIGAKTPTQAFLAGSESRKATRRLGIRAGQAWEIARAAYVGLCAHWDENNPADSVEEFFENEIASLKPKLQGQ